MIWATLSFCLTPLLLPPCWIAHCVSSYVNDVHPLLAASFHACVFFPSMSRDVLQSVPRLVHCTTLAAKESELTFDLESVSACALAQAFSFTLLVPRSASLIWFSSMSRVFLIFFFSSLVFFSGSKLGCMGAATFWNRVTVVSFWVEDTCKNGSQTGTIRPDA